MAHHRGIPYDQAGLRRGFRRQGAVTRPASWSGKHHQRVVAALEFLVDDGGDPVPVAPGKTCPNFWVADPGVGEVLRDGPEVRADSVVVDERPAAPIVALGVGVDDGEAHVVTDDLRAGVGAELLEVPLDGGPVSGERLGQPVPDGPGDSCTHRVVAVAAVNDDVEFPLEGQCDQVTGDGLHLSRGAFGRSGRPGAGRAGGAAA